MTDTAGNPLVITLAIDDATQQRFDRERAELFPSGRTAVGAHVTLFHAVPGDLIDSVRHDLAEAAGPVFPVGVAGVRSLGRGVAYELDAPELVRRHRSLQRSWWSHLTKQDQQGFRPHVTVQNKVEPDVARATLERLRAAFTPFETTATGFTLWRYDGGPWTRLEEFGFRAEDPPASR